MGSGQAGMEYYDSIDIYSAVERLINGYTDVGFHRAHR